MQLSSESFEAGKPIPGRCAFAVPHAVNHVELSDNKNPHLAWSGLPEGTASLVLTCHDPDVPSKPDDVNQEGKTVPAGLPRVDFTHWVLVDLDPAAGSIAEGAHSSGVTPRGKDGPAAPGGGRHGVNNYTQWFAGDADMEGQYFGYDGPCPPWNDSILHHYHFTLYALSEPCAVDGSFTREQVLAAIEGKVLGEASLVGTYSLNPDVT
ncbi:MAG: YbhB/YbcL family Raf kinase inhibitor-like protein [Myxococcales bacterium]|nr:YbhB/YbcL family Raf kinase inhibitor-like protein [Myxococcales bacterium]